MEITSTKIIQGFECKATIKTAEETLKDYQDQLQWHYLIGRSITPAYILCLIHYNTAIEGEFDLNNCTVTPVEIDKTIQSEILTGLQIISEAIKDFQYEKKDELMAYDLPESVQLQIEALTEKMNTVAKMNAEVEEFKEKMIKLMQENNVKSIKNEYFNMTVVNESVAIGFDKDRLKKDLPEVYEKYNTKKSNKKAFIKITLKN